ncbi:b667bbc1-a6d7-413c-9dea-2dac2004f552 [Sclerotinia trifoliorum]|uniref:B667bbc1-a6d7-413c-9dea-2dac2004f552 n=1 Tax=Sclerotinia trifoliorum TaxID=28548 RepID=A0A8H2ZJV5_9HELO|nr:b667bbc1-a6d7-413c-9dea-2dac2004f552 [Sclerotinia trifoliorum]
MKPRGLAISIGSGSNGGHIISRIFSDPNEGNLAIALLRRDQQNLPIICPTILKQKLRSLLQTRHTHNNSQICETTSRMFAIPRLSSPSPWTSLSPPSTPIARRHRQTRSLKTIAKPSTTVSKPSNPLYVYEKSSRPKSEGKDPWQLIGSFISSKRAAIFLGLSPAEVQKYAISGEVYKELYKFSYK